MSAAAAVFTMLILMGVPIVFLACKLAEVIEERNGLAKQNAYFRAKLGLPEIEKMDDGEGEDDEVQQQLASPNL